MHSLSHRNLYINIELRYEKQITPLITLCA